MVRWYHLLTAVASKANHAISAKTGYYIAQAKYTVVRVEVEWKAPASNRCTHTLAIFHGKHYCLSDSITLTPTNLAPLELLIRGLIVRAFLPGMFI